MKQTCVKPSPSRNPQQHGRVSSSVLSDVPHWPVCLLVSLHHVTEGYLLGHPTGMSEGLNKSSAAFFTGTSPPQTVHAAAAHQMYTTRSILVNIWIFPARVQLLHPPLIFTGGRSKNTIFLPYRAATLNFEPLSFENGVWYLNHYFLILYAMMTWLCPGQIWCRSVHIPLRMRALSRYSGTP